MDSQKQVYDFQFTGDYTTLNASTLTFWLERSDKYQQAISDISGDITSRAYTFLNINILLANGYAGFLISQVMATGGNAWLWAISLGTLPLIISFFLLAKAIRIYRFLYLGDMPKTMWAPEYIVPGDLKTEKLFNLLHQLERAQEKIDINRASNTKRGKWVTWAFYMMLLSPVTIIITLVLSS